MFNQFGQIGNYGNYGNYGQINPFQQQNFQINQNCIYNPKILYEFHDIYICEDKNNNETMFLERVQPKNYFEKPYYFKTDQNLEDILFKLITDDTFVDTFDWDQKKNTNLIKKIFSDGKLLESFLNVLYSEKDIADALIFKIDSAPIFALICELAKEQKIPLPWSKDPQIKQKLFLKWAHSESGDSAINLMLEDHSYQAIINEVGEGLLLPLIDKGAEKTVALFEKIMKESGKLSQSNLWLLRAFHGTITEQDANEFEDLPEEVQDDIFRIANIYGHEKLVTLIKNLFGGKGEESTSNPELPYLVSDSMDAVQAQNAILEFISELDQDYRFLTQADFVELKEENPTIKFKNKGDFGRLIGRELVAKKIKELGLKHVKVPNKVAVISNKIFTITLSKGEYPLLVNSNDIIVYAEKIKSANRCMKIEEMQELITLIDAIGYRNIYDDNFIVAKDGVYLIDTKYESFNMDIDDERLCELKANLVSMVDERYSNAFAKIKKDAKQQDLFKIAQPQNEDQIQRIKQCALAKRCRPFTFELG